MLSYEGKFFNTADFDVDQDLEEIPNKRDCGKFYSKYIEPSFFVYFLSMQFTNTDHLAVIGFDKTFV